MAEIDQSWRRVRVGWRAPLNAAHPTPPGPRELRLLTSTAADGVTGFGEDASLPGYAGSDAAAARAAAVDVAALDLAARRNGLSLWQALGARRPLTVALNATIGADAPEHAAAQAREAVAAGFRTIKLKAGDDRDLERLRAVRTAVGREVALRIDANGAWSVGTAIARLRELALFDLELCEEPVHGVGELCAVAAALPELVIAADESAGAVLAAGQRAGGDGNATVDGNAAAGGNATVDGNAAVGGNATARERAAGPRAVCLKVSRGGITALLRDAARARALGLEVYLASTLDGPLGIAAGLHAAALIVPDRACGLATLDRFDRPVPQPLVPVAGTLRPPAGVGLGDGLLDWYGPR